MANSYTETLIISGINNANPDTTYRGESDPWEVWAGWDNTNVANRIVINSYSNHEDDWGGMNNRCNVRFYFKGTNAPGPSGSRFCLMNYKYIDLIVVTWNKVENNNTGYATNRVRSIGTDLNHPGFYYLDIPKSVVSNLYNKGWAIVIREVDKESGLIKAKTVYYPTVSDRPFFKYWYMNCPSYFTAIFTGNSSVYSTWGSNIEGDDFWSGYRIVDDSGKEWFNGTGTLLLGTRFQTISNLPNGKEVTLRIHGKYDNTNYGTSYSTFYKEQKIKILNAPINLSASIVGEKVDLSWEAPPKNGGNNPSKYIIQRIREPFTLSWENVGETTKTSYSITSAFGRYRYRVIANYGTLGNSSPSSYVETFIDTSPSISINTTKNLVVDPNNFYLTFFYFDYDLDDNIQEIYAEVYDDTNNLLYSKTFKRSDMVNLTEGNQYNSYFIAGGNIKFDNLPENKSINIKIKAKDKHGGKWSAFAESTFKTNARPQIDDISLSAENYINCEELPIIVSFKFVDPDICPSSGADYCRYIRYLVYDKNDSLVYDSGNIAPLEGGSGQVKNGNYASFSVNLDKKKTYYLKVRTSDNHSFSNSDSDYSGPFKICVYEETNPATFTYVSPAITSVSKSRGEQGESISIYGTNFGDKQNNSEIRYLNSWEIMPDSWSDTIITFKTPITKENALLLGKTGDDLDPYPYLTSPSYSGNKIGVIPHPGDKAKYVYNNGEVVKSEIPFSIYAKTPILSSETPILPTMVGTNQAVAIYGSDFGPFWEYNMTNRQKAMGYAMPGDNLQKRKILVSAIKKIYDEETQTFIYIPDGNRTAEVLSYTLGSWNDDKILMYVPEDAASTFYISSPWSSSDSNMGEFFVQDLYIDKTKKYYLYWGEICTIEGNYFGDIKGNSKIELIVDGKVVELTKNVTFSNTQISFLFGGFNLSMFPSGEFPFGKKTLLRVSKYFTDGQLRCTDSVEVECWRSKEEQHAYIQAQETLGKNVGYGVDETTYGLTSLPGGGGYAQKTIRIVNGDFSFGPSGNLEFITRRPKLLQDLLIAILTPFSNDKYHPEYGCRHQFRIGDVLTEEWQENEIKSEIFRIISDYMNRQKAQFYFKQSKQKLSQQYLVWDTEYIKAIKDIKVKVKLDFVFIKITLMTGREDIELKAKFKLGG